MGWEPAQPGLVEDLEAGHWSRPSWRRASPTHRAGRPRGRPALAASSTAIRKCDRALVNRVSHAQQALDVALIADLPPPGRASTTLLPAVVFIPLQPALQRRSR